MALVLCTGVNPVLMKTRQLILENAGHIVLSATDEREIKAVSRKQKFDVAIIGQSISSIESSRAGRCAGTLPAGEDSGAYPRIREPGARRCGRMASNAV